MDDAFYHKASPSRLLLLFASLLISSFVFSAAQAAPRSRLSYTQPLNDGATLVSPGSIFELGFFSPGKSPNRYIGIWYHNFSTSTVLWVANRESPVPDNSGSLAIASDGNLVILDGRKAVLWSSKVDASLLRNESTAELLDTGNLLLHNSGNAVWQSFDYPTDTYLPGMKIGLDLITNVNQVFTSWRSQDDPAPGNFTMGIAPDQSTQIFIWEGSKPRWRSGRWNGQVFLGIPNMVPTYIYGFKLSNFELEKKMYFYYSQFNSSHRYVINYDGIDRHLIWANETKNWYQFWAEPITQCELYNRCGDYATCTDSADGKTPTCSCLKGFEWGSGNSANQCVRSTPLQCQRNNSSTAASGQGKPDGFYLVKGVKLPDLSFWYEVPANESQCLESCSTNCSCKAYSYVTGIGCLIWGRELADMHLFSSGGHDFYLRLAQLEFEDHNKRVTKYDIIIIVLSAVFMLVGAIFMLWKYKTIMEAFYRRMMESQESLSGSRRGVEEQSGEFSTVIDMNEQGKGGRDVPQFSFRTIEEATESFSSSNLLGRGGFGPVYKGKLPNGQDVAVKRLCTNSGQGMKEFKNEVILIAKLQHRNLVRLLGYCIRKEDKMLVYEYMANRSLDAFLFDTNRKLLLDWKVRYSIIEGIARGLLYLHRDSRLRIIHRDLKTSNILLDENMNPKISDFGMARIFGEGDGNESSTKRVVGSIGYMSPEYAMQGLFSVKSDVYSFGVILIEIVTGERNSAYYNSELSLNLLGCAWKLWNEDNVMELVDPSIRSTCSLRDALRCINVGLLCIQDRANDRPTMSSVIMMLESDKSINPMPKQPKFAAEITASDTDTSTYDQKFISVNASFTMQAER